MDSQCQGCAVMQYLAQYSHAKSEVGLEQLMKEISNCSNGVICLAKLNIKTS